MITASPAAGRLLVNFDKGILQLMREARYMQRLGLPVPQAAQVVLLQEEKFKLYFAQLTHAIKVGSHAARDAAVFVL